MKYYSLHNPSIKVSFQEALIQGIAADRGLFFPEYIPQVNEKDLLALPKNDLAFALIQPFVGEEIPEPALKQIIAETLNFDFPLHKLSNNNYFLELFHGPTLAFKDVGARFMSRCLAYFNQNSNKKVCVLVATSGDTGGAVAHGFYKVDGVEVVILYPKGRVSKIQEKQLCTLGHNIKALEVDGSFDDCQEMVKTAFLDAQIQAKVQLTSANSINVARWLPQMFYFAFAYQALYSQNLPIFFSVPSGNFGNICAGLLLKNMGFNIHSFMAACNANDVIPHYLATGNYKKQASISTISNAMDVTNPSNFIRIEALYQNELSKLRNDVFASSFSDAETQNAMKALLAQENYIADPHGAVGYLGLLQHKLQFPNTVGVAIETAHPCKFLEVVEETLAISIQIPEAIQDLMHVEKKSTQIASYEELKHYLLA